MFFIEKYPRPCFAISTEGNQGVILFENHSQSETIHSINAGREMIEDLVNSEKISREDGQRLSDHLLCSDLPEEAPAYQAPYALGLLALALLGKSITPSDTPRHKHQCPKCNKIWEHGPEALYKYEAHRCPDCRTLQRMILNE